MDIVVLLFWFLIVLILPGSLLYNLFFNKKQEDLLFYLPLFFAFSLILMTPLGLLAYIFNWSWGVFSSIFFSLVTLLLILNSFYRKPTFKISISLDWVSKTVLFIIISASVFMIFIPPVFDFTDAPFHIGQIRKLIDSDFISPIEAFIPTGKIAPPYGYNIWYIALAFISKWSTVDLLEVWDRIAIFLVPGYLSSIYFFGSKLFQDRRAGLIVLIVSITILVLGTNVLDFRTIAYPSRVNQLIILPVSFGLFFEYIRLKRALYLSLFILLGFVITTIHLFAWVYLLLALSAFLLMNLLLRNKSAFITTLKSLLGVLLIPLPYLFLKLQDISSISGLPEIPETRGYFLSFLGLLKHPFYAGSFILLASLLFIFWGKWRKMVWLIFLTSTSLIALLILFTPVLFPLVADIISYTNTIRIIRLINPELIWSAFFFYFILAQPSVSKILERYLLVILSVVLIVVMFALPFIDYKGTYPFQSQIQIKEEFSFRRKSKPLIFDFIKDKLPIGQVFAADYWISYQIPTYSYQYIVMTYPSHTSFTVDKKTRIDDLDFILDLNSDLTETVKKLKKYEANYVILRKSIVKLNNGNNKFVKKPELFKQIYEDNSFILYQTNL